LSSQVGERLYLYNDHTLGVRGNKDPDVIARHVARYDAAIEAVGVTGGIWLDFACGSGYGTEAISRVADYVYGVDPDPLAIEYARKWHSGPRRSFHTTPRPADVVVSIETLEHMPRDAQHEWVAGIDCAVLALMCPIGNGPSTCNPWHLHEPTEPELRAMLESHFSDVTITREEYVSTFGEHAVQALAVCR
jgi:SAM-dependent methyltransferase